MRQMIGLSALTGVDPDVLAGLLGPLFQQLVDEPSDTTRPPTG
jgi:hypothetical protein